VLAYRTRDDRVAVVRFEAPEAHYFGPPNDEAREGHPLAPAGLQLYGAQEVKGSPWLKDLEERNQIHSAHDPHHYASLRHFIFSFHDSTFECVARDLSAEVHEGTPEQAVASPAK
jgi:hypothetical protein